MTEDFFELVGTSLDGKYRVDEAIGEGGFGVVYRGELEIENQGTVAYDETIPLQVTLTPPSG
jgi:hypothetical protein